MSAETIARALKGRKSGSNWIAHCPAHDDREPSLSIREANDGKILVCCHAGCAQKAVITELRQRGLWGEEGLRGPKYSASKPDAPVKPDHEDAKRSTSALKIWQSTQSAYGTVAETYLRSRGLHSPLPETIRFHPGLKHRTGDRWPVMVALVTRGVDDEPLAIHRTFLARDGSGKAPVDPQKMMLGPCHGGAVRLAPANDLLMVGEGIETCLAAIQATGHPAWAALSTSGLTALDLPHEVREVIVLADGDATGERAAHKAAVRWRREGRRVRIARPAKGMDFNDMLMGRSARIGEGNND
jgi:hypothetical protein